METEAILLPAPPEKPKRIRKKKEACRDFEILHTLPSSKMNNVETAHMVDSLRGQINELSLYIERYQEETRNVYDDNTRLRVAMKDLQREANRIITYTRRQISTCHEAVLMVGELKGEE